MSLAKDYFENESDPALQEFVCAICLNVPLLNEACVATRACQHVFCTNCYREWKEKTERCPTCNRIPNSDEHVKIFPLKETSPLGFRVLGRFRVKCPIKDCNWHGDFSEFDSHLTNSDTHKQDNNSVTALKELGNERFAAGRFDEALKLYDKAFASSAQSDPGIRAILQSNRAAALLKLNRPSQASEACSNAVSLGSKDVKVFVRWNQALTQCGRFDEAIRVLENAPKEIQPSVAIFLRKSKQLKRLWEESGSSIAKGDYEAAKVQIAGLLSDSNSRLFSQVVSRAALVESHIGNVDLALKLSLEAVRSSPDDEQAWIARAHALVSNGQFDEARQCAKVALRSNPDDDSAKSCSRFVRSVETQVQEARKAADRHDYESARKLLLELVTGSTLPKSSPLRVQLLAERAHASFQAGLFQDALKDASQAIYQQDDNQRAWLTRLYCLRELGRFEEAVQDARELLQRWGSNDLLIRNAAEKAEFDLRKSKRPDLYGVLGVSSLASEMEIKQAYKQKALVFHPDKLGPNATEEQKKACEDQFKLLGFALDVLGNQEKRELWDKGYDLQGIQEELERRRRRSH